MATSTTTKWKTISLEKECWFERGMETGADAYNTEGIGDRFIRVVDITESRDNPIFVDGIHTTKRAKKKDILLTLDGTVGAIRTGLEGIYSTGVRKVSFRNGHYSNRLLFYLLQSDRVQRAIDLYASGSTIKHASASIPHLFVDVPENIQEQEKIADILVTLDQTIEKTESLISKWGRVRAGMMQNLFQNGIDADGRVRPEKTHKFKNSIIGRVPNEWEIKTLGSITEKIGDGIHTTPTYSLGTEYFFINGNNLQEGKIVITKNTMCVSEKEYELLKKNLNNQTLLISINGTIGNLAYFKNEKVVLGKSAAYLNLRPTIDINYIYYFLQTVGCTEFFKKELTGTTINNLSLATIRNTPVPLPSSKKEQEAISSSLMLLDNTLERERSKRAKLLSIKEGLMGDLLTPKK